MWKDFIQFLKDLYCSPYFYAVLLFFVVWLVVFMILESLRWEGLLPWE